MGLNMELDYYLWKNKICQSTFSKQIDIAQHTLNKIVNKKSNPTLLTALKIHFETKGYVSLFELLRPEDRQILHKMYSIVKNESLIKDIPDERIINLPVGVHTEKEKD